MDSWLSALPVYVFTIICSLIMVYLTTPSFMRLCSFKLVQNDEFEKREEGSGYGLF